MKALFWGALLALVIGCGNSRGRGGDSDRGSSRDDDQDDSRGDSGSGSSHGSGPSADDCYYYGYLDCEDLYEPDPGYWSCGSSDYWEGYCDCEYDYADWYYCE